MSNMEYDELAGIDGQKYTIMVVDDIPLNTRLLEKILEKGNFKLYVYNNSQKAMDNFELVNPDILLVDVMMPGIDGISFVTRIRNNHAFDHTRIIVVSAVSEQDEIQRAVSIGANDYITKPINAARVISSVAKQIHIIEGTK